VPVAKLLSNHNGAERRIGLKKTKDLMRGREVEVKTVKLREGVLHGNPLFSLDYRRDNGRGKERDRRASQGKEAAQTGS